MGNAKYNGLPAAAQYGSDAKTIQHNAQGQDCTSEPERASAFGDVASAAGIGFEGQGAMGKSLHTKEDCSGQADKPLHAFSGVWIDCPDGKQRLIEPSICLLANGIPARASKLRAYGNAIVPAVAAQFIKASLEAIRDVP
jgi:hypothetical protein